MSQATSKPSSWIIITDQQQTSTVAPELHRLEKGIITESTISVMLFPLAINMLVKFAMLEGRGTKTKSFIGQPLIRAFMDDLTVRTVSVPVVCADGSSRAWRG